MTLGELIRYTRRNKKITLKEIGQKTGLSFSQIAKIERNEHTPTKKTILKISSALDIEPNTLLPLAGYAEIDDNMAHAAFEVTVKESQDLTRYKVLSKYNLTCQICGKMAPMVTLHVDHIIPIAVGGEISPENLTILCTDCHNGRIRFLGEEKLENDILYRRHLNFDDN